MIACHLGLRSMASEPLTLSSDPAEALAGLLERPLFSPLEEFLSRPSKKIRAALVDAGFRVGSGGRAPTATERRWIEEGGNLLEALHAGSLIVDDIQDRSRVRRGAPALHLLCGVPIALNAGNFLYFWPLERIADWGLDAERELALTRLCHRTLVRAHSGQAIDLATDMSNVARERAETVCLASLELKSGALTALALQVGGVIGGATPERLKELAHYGVRFGAALQMFDDVGNYSTELAAGERAQDVGASKRLEDLYARRPSWVWGAAARLLDERGYADLVTAALRLPDESYLRAWEGIHDFASRARAAAREWLDASFGAETETWDSTACARLRELGEKVANAYG